MSYTEKSEFTHILMQKGKVMTTQMFLNAIFDFKLKDNAFVTIPPVLREVLREGGWMPERLLFDLYDKMKRPAPHIMLIETVSPAAAVPAEYLRTICGNESKTCLFKHATSSNEAPRIWLFSPTSPGLRKGQQCSGRMTRPLTWKRWRKCAPSQA